MDNDVIGSRLNRIQLDLFSIDNPMAVGTTGQIESVLLDISDLIGLAFQNAEMPHLPPSPAQVVTVQPRPVGDTNGSGSITGGGNESVSGAVNAGTVQPNVSPASS
jgi:hypothetical protein